MGYSNKEPEQNGSFTRRIIVGVVYTLIVLALYLWLGGGWQRVFGSN